MHASAFRSAMDAVIDRARGHNPSVLSLLDDKGLEHTAAGIQFDGRQTFSNCNFVTEAAYLFSIN